MRILYVEDNPELRETIGMLMEGEGRTVTSCASAEGPWCWMQAIPSTYWSPM